jgi:hypothetical protein
LIWIVLSLIVAVFSLIQTSFANTAILGLISNSAYVLAGIFGIFAVARGSRVLVKVYGLFSIFLMVVSTALSIYTIYDPNTKKQVQEIFEKNSPNAPIGDFDQVFGVAQMFSWVYLAIFVFVNAISLAFLWAYYKFLNLVEHGSLQKSTV